jgi:hypothetical protein
MSLRRLKQILQTLSSRITVSFRILGTGKGMKKETETEQEKEMEMEIEMEMEMEMEKEKEKEKETCRSHLERMSEMMVPPCSTVLETDTSLSIFSWRPISDLATNITIGHYIAIINSIIKIFNLFQIVILENNMCLPLPALPVAPAQLDGTYEAEFGLHGAASFQPHSDAFSRPPDQPAGCSVRAGPDSTGP